MARSGGTARHSRGLLALVAIFLVLFGVIGAGTVWSDAQWTPKLALDLEGGTQIILTPVPQAGEEGTITDAQVAEAVRIIRQRVDGSGVAETEVTTQGNRNIVVALPGNPDERTRNLVKQSAELSFRPVLVEQAAAPPQPEPGATPAPSGSPAPSPTPASSATPAARSGATPAPSASGRVDAALQRRPLADAAPSAAAATPDPAATPAPAPEPQTAPDASGSTGTGASDLKQITPAVEAEFTALDCSDLEKLQLTPSDPKKVLVTCSQDGAAKYILGPVEVRGTDIKTATAALGTNSQGFSTGEWQVQLEFNGDGARKFADVTGRLTALTGAQNQFAIVLDNLVVSAPRTNERIPSGNAEISGNFTQDSAATLANQLKFGALPISFRVETEERISALLGGEQLQRGLLAGLIGLILVVVYSLLQYRALGLVTVASLVIAGTLTYGMVVLLGWRQGYRLSLPGVAGLIVAIGITADSFIVFFERIRDEVRDGRALPAAVEAAWVRARRTILASDAVSFLAAVVLYLLAVGGVRGFAFTLGLTTIIDVIVVFLFTKPMVSLLARTEFFGGGHRLSGFSPEQLGRPPAYVGRGRIRPSPAPAARPAGPRTTIAARRAADRAAGAAGAAGAVDDLPDDDVAPGEPSAGGTAAGGGRSGSRSQGQPAGSRGDR